MVFYATEKSPIAGREGKKPRYIHGFVEANMLWRDYEPRKDYLVFGDSGTALYTLHLSEKAFQERDRQSFDLILVHPTLEAMLAEAMEHHKPPNP